MKLIMVTSEPMVAYLPEPVFPLYHPNRPLDLQARQSASTVCLGPRKTA
jgi:hypothetical protein